MPEEIKAPEIDQSILHGAQNPYKVYLPMEKEEITLRLATGMDEFVAHQRFKGTGLDSRGRDDGFYELEIIALCVKSFPGHPEFGQSATEQVTFNSLLFLHQLDIKILKLAHTYANMPDPKTQDMIDRFIAGHQADAFMEAMYLALKMGGGFQTIDAAMKLPHDTRQEMVERTMALLGVHPKQKQAED